MLRASQAIVIKDRVYMLGGWSSDSGYISTIYSALINSDGTLGSWTTDGNLPVVLVLSQTIVIKDKVYMLGGESNGYISDIYSAPISGGLNDYTSF